MSKYEVGGIFVVDSGGVSPVTWLAARVEVMIVSDGHVSSPDSTATADPPADEEALLRGGELIAGRYRLLRPLGRGGHGEVWEASDGLGGGTIAIKLYRAGLRVEPGRVQREILALRVLRLPGVVRLLDEGVEGGRPFLVMERVDGTPFPGEGTARSWASMAEPTVALLETLARVHAAGVVHRDLKPANVLVNRERRPTLLDFGISCGARLGEGLTEHGYIIGTPAYLAPEQILKEPLSARTDLYSLGVILYEALAGRLPHVGGDRNGMLRSKLSERAPPLVACAPGVPHVVAGLVDLLLSREPGGRPRSAAEVLGILRGQPIADLSGSTLPRLDGDAPVNALVQFVRAGRAVDLVGAPKTGRTRCLQEAAEVLQGEGLRVAWTVPGWRAFSSLEQVVGVVDDRASTIAEAMDIVDARLDAALSDGVVLVADDLERLDRWSAAAIERRLSRGVILRAMAQGGESGAEDVVRLEPLDEEGLARLFSGPERVFHLKSDAARILWARTEGLQARVAEEITAWLRAGIARWDGSTLAVDRDTLERLESGLRVALGDRGGSSNAGAGAMLPAHLEELSAWIAVAAPVADARLLGAAMGLPVWRVEADIEDLLRRGAIRRMPGGRVEPRWAGDVGWSPDRTRFAHRAIAAALPEGAEGRLLHLIAGASVGSGDGDSIEVAREAEMLARRLAREGRLGQTIAAIEEGLLMVRRGGEPAEERTAAEERLLTLWVEVALSVFTPEAHDRVLYELCRVNHRTEAIRRLEDLVRAAVAFVGGGERAAALLRSIAPFQDLNLERHRQGLRVLAARRCSQAMEEAVLEEVAAWAKGTGDAATQARLAGWMGRLRYRQGRYAEAAALHAVAAEREPWATARIAARLNGASALMEAFRLRDAAEQAEMARQQAQDGRHAFFEARAEWILRSTAYRMGEVGRPDLELVDAASRLGVGDLEGSVCFCEAAIAYRTGELERALALAAKARSVWQAIQDPWPAVLVRCLALAAGAAPEEPREIEDLAERATTCEVPGIGLQALALLARARRGRAPAAWRRAALPLTAGVPVDCWPIRMDVLSVDESLDALGVPPRDRRP